MRKRAEWMTPFDDQILEVLHSSQLVLSPSIIAFNLERSREGVSKRLSELTSHGLVEKIERGKYEISGKGEAYLAGDLDASELNE
ncbi:MarR family transcriptional regulator [Haladaptatus sp. ZSTT2]|uniref:MarR family transcriptional regulator n=1 Tax=Haladaptatus sp. ZSTT2 TaxID=3120515 RepID=UPI00300EBD85